MTRISEDRFGSRVPPVGTVLRWRHQGMTHVGLHIKPETGASTWRTTAREGDLTWEHVRALIGNNPCAVASGWVAVATLDAVDFGDTEVDAYVGEWIAPGRPDRYQTPIVGER